MGPLREKSLGKTILTILATGALVFAAIAAPNAIQILAPLVQKKRGRSNPRSLERAIHRLRTKRLIEFTTQGEKTMLQITENGKKRVRELEFEKMMLEIPPKWNGKWTIILFDIPEDKKKARDAFREKIRSLGCFPYHKSVFVHPSDCRDEIDFVADVFNIQRHVIHFQTASLGSQEYRPRKFFGLL